MTTFAPARLTHLRADPALPWRDALLDDAQTAALFATTLGLEGPLPIDRVERRRVKYRVGESLRSLHRVWSGERSWLVSARMRASGAAALYAAAARHDIACPPLRGTSLHEPSQTVCWTFPNDRVLGDAAALDAGTEAIRAAWPGQALHVDIAGYNPERAVIGRVRDHALRPIGFAKVYADGGLAPARAALGWLAAATPAALRVPRLLASDPARRLLVVDAVPGRHLDDLAAAELPGAFHALGRALGAVHALPAPVDALPPLPGFTGEDLRHAAAVVAWARPDLGDRAARLADRLEQQRPRGGALVGLHGDMNSRNWLLDGDRVGLIDFDQAAHGPAAADLAGVLAWLRARTVTGAWPAAREHELGAALRAGYAAVRPLPPRPELRWWIGAALLVERALRAVSRVRLDQLACLEALLAEAAVCAEDTERG